MKRPSLLAVGGAHIDRRGQVAGTYVPGASNPGTMREEVGGGAFNALRCAARRGIAGALLSARGGDAAGEAAAAAIREAQIADLSAVFLDRATPSYTAIVDQGGDIVAALADMALYEFALPKQIRRAKVREAIGSADAVLCDANLPADALRRLAGMAEGRAIFAIAISPAKAPRLASILPSLSCLFMNAREALALSGPSGMGPADAVVELRSRGLGCGVISQGGGLLVGFDDRDAFQIRPPPPRRMADVTGAGDALAGATIAAWLHGRSFSAAVREGVAAALLTVESWSSAPSFDAADFEAALDLVPQPERMA